MISTQTQTHPVIEDANGGRALWHFGALLVFKALSHETGGKCWVLEGLADRNMAVPLHAHAREDELWYVIEGEIAFIAGDKTVLCGPGATVFIPRNTPHTFQVKSETARWFGVGIDGNLDQWFFETGEPAKSLTLPPPPDGPPSPEAIQAINDSLRVYGTDTLGPPPGI